MNDTIAAIASGITASGIGIIRISGPEAFPVLEKIFRPAGNTAITEYRTHSIHYGWICEGDSGEGPVIDECLVMFMKGPHTFTTEDTVEINCHGGLYVMRRVLDAVLMAGARIADPGEFTKRAFLGGRIDLTEAEAVMDVISSTGGDALKASLNQLSGSVRRSIEELRETLLHELAYIEAALDDPEHMDLEGYPDMLLKRLEPVTEKMQGMYDSFGRGRMVRDGILTVILGKPNAGKSSLLNALSGEEKAIVTDIEGTTRDILEEHIEIGGLSLRLLDTAGIRDARNEIEQIGIERAKACADDADLILAVFDSARPVDANDESIFSIMENHKSVLLLNKSDLPPVLTEEMLAARTDAPIVKISARENMGFDSLETVIRNMFFSGDIHLNEETLITNARHRDALGRAIKSLGLVRQSIEDGMPEDFFSIDLMDAYSALGEIIGEGVGDDLADAIFSKFCMGK